MDEKSCDYQEHKSKASTTEIYLDKDLMLTNSVSSSSAKTKLEKTKVVRQYLSDHIPLTHVKGLKFGHQTGRGSVKTIGVYQPLVQKGHHFISFASDQNILF